MPKFVRFARSHFRNIAKIIQRGRVQSCVQIVAAFGVILYARPAEARGRFQNAPVIVTQPANVTAVAGSEAVLFARARGAGELSLQWLRDGIPLLGKTEPVLRLERLNAGHAGDYRIVIANAHGRATSDVARVTVETPDVVPAAAAPVVVTCAVGYVNVLLSPGHSLLVNPLSWAGANGGETVSNVLWTLPDGMVIHQVTAGGFTSNARLGEWRDPTAPLPMGDVFFVFNPFELPVSVILVGAVVEGDLRQSLPAGYCLAASLVPQSGALVTVLEFPVEPGDAVWRWDKASQSYFEFNFGLNGWLPDEPVITLPEAFVARKDHSAEWRRQFSVSVCLTSYGPVPRPSLLATSGQLHFFTYNPDPAFGRVEGAGSDYFGQLYVGLTTNESDLVPTGTPVPFLDGEYAGYLNGGMVRVPGSTAGQVANAQLRIWCGRNGASYEAAIAAGGFTTRSEIVAARTEAPLADGRPGLPPRPVNSFPTLRLPQVPRFVVQPAGQTVAIGQNATLSASATGAEPLIYQWRHNGAPIPGANGPELHLSNLQRTDAGDYSVTVSNAICSLNSANARLVVYEPIQIVEVSPDHWFAPPALIHLHVTAAGDGPLHYQWFAGSAPMSGSNSQHLYVWSDAVNPDRPYSVSVSNYFGAVTSRPILVRPLPRLSIELRAAGELRLVWPKAASQFVLEQSAGLTGDGFFWSAGPGPVVLAGENFVVSLPSGANTNRWFRLRLE